MDGYSFDYFGTVSLDNLPICLTLLMPDPVSSQTSLSSPLVLQPFARYSAESLLVPRAAQLATLQDYDQTRISS